MRTAAFAKFYLDGGRKVSLGAGGFFSPELVAVFGIRQWTSIELAEDAVAVAGDEVVSLVAQEFWEDSTKRRQHAPATTQFAEDEKSSVRARPQELPWLIKIRDDIKRIEIRWGLSVPFEDAARLWPL